MAKDAAEIGTENTVNFLVAIPVGLICAEILSRLLRLRVRQAAERTREGVDTQVFFLDFDGAVVDTRPLGEGSAVV